jgi:hypothetical protein
MENKIETPLFESYLKRFKQIDSYRPGMVNEYSFWTGSSIDEAGEEELPADPNAGGEMPPVDGGGDEGVPGEGAPQSELPQDGVPAEDPNIPPVEPNGGEMPPVEGDMEAGGEFEDVDMDDDTVEVDVTDLTDKQDETSAQLKQLDDKFEKFSSIADKLVNAFNQVIKKSEEQEKVIASVKDEIIKRAPTDVESMRIRSVAGAPYNEPVADFWRKEAATNPNYNIEINNKSDVEDEEYVLTDSDINTFSDNEIYNSFIDDDDKNIFGQNLKKLTGF